MMNSDLIKLILEECFCEVERRLTISCTYEDGKERMKQIESRSDRLG